MLVFGVSGAQKKGVENIITGGSVDVPYPNAPTSLFPFADWIRSQGALGHANGKHCADRGLKLRQQWRLERWKEEECEMF